MTPSTSDIRRISTRIARLEAEMSAVTRCMRRVAGWFSRRRRANAVSRHLSGPEVCDLRAQMRAHGVEDAEEDDDSRNERGAHAKHR